jgi:probable F420-dependent oxidoreductase
VIGATDAATARRVGRAWVGRYLELTNYRENLLRLGFTAADLANGGSDRLVDALIAWGDPAAIRKRVEEHWAAGADHVCIQALDPTEATPARPDDRLLAALAPAAVR